MSSTTLAPHVASTLDEFGRRRIRLLTTRTICAAILTFVTSMAVVGLLDWLWILSDLTRWILSLTAYAFTFVAVWVIGGRRLVRSQGRKALATQVEFAQPELRENLLSAVELATDTPGDVRDSPVFRGLLQKSVAGKMANVDVEGLLPMRLLASWLVTTLPVAATVIALLLWGGPEFRSLAARAVFPIANVDRVSRIQVEIVEPTPHSILLARNETVAVVIRTTGGHVDGATLETSVDGGTVKQTRMQPRSDSEFGVNLHVDGESIQYRVLAGDAVTRRYTITGKGRPKVTAFHKTYAYPEYTRLEAVESSEDHGNLTALAGTTVTMTLDVDQPVSIAELRIASQRSDTRETRPLELREDGLWEARIEVKEDCLYQVYLVGKTTQFDNPYSPRYEIQAVADLVPRAGFVDLEDTDLLLPPNDILTLQAVGEDDLPLEDLSQEFSINGRDWVSIPLPATPVDTDDSESDGSARFRAMAGWNWDLLDLNLKTGDEITTRVVATDRRGSRGESVPIRIVIASPEFDPDRHAVMHRRAALLENIDRYSREIQERKGAASELVQTLRDATRKGGTVEPTETETRRMLTTLSNLANDIRTSSFDLYGLILAEVSEMPAGTASYELDLAGQVVAKIACDHSSRILHGTTAFKWTADARQLRTIANEIRIGFERSAEDAKSLSYHYRHLVGQDVFAAIATDFAALQQQQNLILNSPTQTFERLRRQETVVVSQLQMIGQLASRQRSTTPDFLIRHLDQLANWTGDWLTKLESAMESKDRLPELRRLSQDLGQEINQRQRYDVIDGGMANRVVQARRDFMNRSGSLIEPLGLTATATAEEARRLARAATAEDSATAELAVSEAESFAVQINGRMRPALKQLLLRRKLTQARIDTDASYASDLGLAERAVDALLARRHDTLTDVTPTSDALLEVSRAWRTLESGHGVANVRGLLDVLTQSERWDALKAVGKIHHPLQWEAVEQGLKEALESLRRAQLPTTVIRNYEQIIQAANTKEAGRRISERRRLRDRPVAAIRQLHRMQLVLDSADPPLLSAMEDARRVLMKYAPSISQMATELAVQLREMESATINAADQLQSQPDELLTDSRVNELNSVQQEINEGLNALLDALMEDANQQDPGDASQRERARDADDSIAMIQQPAQQMNQMLRDATAADSNDGQAVDLSQAAEQQEKTAEVLEQIADHFGRLNSDSNVAESRAALRQAERQLGIARLMDQRFEESSPTSPTADEEKMTAMEVLEEELKRNPAMQEALSEIARDTVAEARNALEDAARQEWDLQKGNERSDDRLQQQKRDMQRKLKQFAEDADRLARSLVNQAEKAAGASREVRAEALFERARQRMQSAASTAQSASENDLLRDLQQKVDHVESAMQQASDALQEGKQRAAIAKNDDTFSSESSRRKARSSMEKEERRFRDQLIRETDQALRQRSNQVRQEKTNLRNSENNEKNIARRLRQAEDRLERKPDDRGAGNQIDQARQQLEQAQQNTKEIRKRVQHAVAAEHDARAERAEVDRISKGELDAKNPAAQLAERMAIEAAARADELRKKSKEIAEALKTTKPSEATRSQLVAAAERQNDVKQDVSETAADLGRAARHESRLDNQNTANVIMEESQKVNELSQEEATDAQIRLTEASTAARVSDGQQQETEDRPYDQRESQRASEQANQALEASESALQTQASALSELLETTDPKNLQEGQKTSASQLSAGAESGAQSVDPSGNSPQMDAADGNQASEPGIQAREQMSPAEQAQGRALARALDLLDRQTASNEPGMSPASLSGHGHDANSTHSRRQASELAQQRSLAQQQSQLSQSSTQFDTKSEAGLTGPESRFHVSNVNRIEAEEWGRLRQKDAEDLTKGRRAQVAEEYRKSVEAYFKVLAERSRRRK